MENKARVKDGSKDGELDVTGMTDQMQEHRVKVD